MKEYNNELEKINEDETIWPFISPEEDEIKIKNSNIEIGRREGLEEGIQKGIEKGKKEGKKEGIEEGVMQEKLNNAKKMLENNLDIEIISKVTGLTEEEIEKLK